MTGALIYSNVVEFCAYSFDPQGNVIRRQNSVAAQYPTYDIASYEAYGKPMVDYSPMGVNPAVNQDPAGFGGQYGYYTDRETGLLCLTHRYYDPGTGRFINRDPIGYQGGVNVYGYAGGNPVNAVDPSGLAITFIQTDQGLAAGQGPLPESPHPSISSLTPGPYAKSAIELPKGPSRSFTSAQRAATRSILVHRFQNIRCN